MRNRIAFIVILVLIMLSTACDNKEMNMSSNENLAEVNVYYIDTITSKIVSEKYTPTETDKVQLVEELLLALRKEPKNIIYKNALPNTITIKEFYFSEDERLTINFDSAYSDLTGIPEVLCRATIVKTLSQIAGIEYIEFSVNGQPFTDSNGIRLMTNEDFIKSTGAETYYKVSLYFTNEVGDTLIEHNTDIYYTGTGSIEEMVINQLIKGPTQIGMYHTIPTDTTLLNVKTKEGICYVDFNEKFLEKVPNINDEVALYSIVNSLVELPNINKVQFLINGELRATYRENIVFDGFFERKLSLIKDSK